MSVGLERFHLHCVLKGLLLTPTYPILNEAVTRVNFCNCWHFARHFLCENITVEPCGRQTLRDPDNLFSLSEVLLIRI